jgi:HCOMODA/2-hydroxy-3-carboxy-muconic semialdehyde decarboxylase
MAIQIIVEAADASAGGGLDCEKQRTTTEGNAPVPNKIADTLYQLALANRIVANEGIIDAFGHVSVRHPDDPNRYFLSRSRSPGLVEPGDILEYHLDSTPVRTPDVTQYSERVIHGEIYKARPDVMAVCHHHAPSFMPLVSTGMDYVPVFHLGATGGARPPFWDQRDDFGDTNMLVVKPEEGQSLAKALGAHWMVLMWRHGVTVAGRSLQDTVFRSVYSARNAEYQLQARAAGAIAPLTPGEVELCAKIATATTGLARSWEYWLHRLAKAGSLPPASAQRRVAPKATKSAKPASAGAGARRTPARTVTKTATKKATKTTTKKATKKSARTSAKRKGR